MLSTGGEIFQLTVACGGEVVVAAMRNAVAMGDVIVALICFVLSLIAGT